MSAREMREQIISEQALHRARTSCRPLIVEAHLVRSARRANRRRLRQLRLASGYSRD